MKNKTSKKSAPSRPKQCCATLEVDGDGTYHCTKHPGHAGPHIAASRQWTYSVELKMDSESSVILTLGETEWILGNSAARKLQAYLNSLFVPTTAATTFTPIMIPQPFQPNPHGTAAPPYWWYSCGPYYSGAGPEFPKP